MDAFDKPIRSAFMLSLCLAFAACEESASLPVTTGVTDTFLAAAGKGEWLIYGRDCGEKSVGHLGPTSAADLNTARG